MEIRLAVPSDLDKLKEMYSIIGIDARTYKEKGFRIFL